jgi:chaperonin GroEL
MAAKDILYEVHGREEILAGVDALANAVKVTLGPKGRNVVLERNFGAPVVSKDGVTVARDIELESKPRNLGAQLVREVAIKTSETAGDGTTTATVLAQALLHEGARMLASGHPSIGLKRGVDRAVAAVVEDLQRQSHPTRDPREIAQVATISANGDEAIGQILADAMEKVGLEGVITIEEGKGTDTTLDVVEGMEFERGYLSPYFATDPVRMRAELTDAYVLITDRKIALLPELLPVLEAVAREGRALLIIADDVESEALATLVINSLRGALRVVAVKAPGFGARRKELLDDIAVLTGGELIAEELGRSLESTTLAQLGQAQRISIDKDTTTIVGGAGAPEAIKARVESLERQIAQSDSEHEREQLQQRLAKLAGGVAVIKLGAASEIELKEKKARVEDALHATRAAVEEGIVAGGGVPLLRAQRALETLEVPPDQQIGVQIVRRALEEPLRQIAANAGAEGSLVVEHVRALDGNQGYNAAKDCYEDLMAAGVIDPTKVVRTALQNAASVAGMMLTTETLIVDRPQPKPRIASATPPLPPGMGF